MSAMFCNCRVNVKIVRGIVLSDGESEDRKDFFLRMDECGRRTQAYQSQVDRSGNAPSRVFGGKA
jgi:hypothetical protein